MVLCRKDEEVLSNYIKSRNFNLQVAVFTGDYQQPVRHIYGEASDYGWVHGLAVFNGTTGVLYVSHVSGWMQGFCFCSLLPS